MPDALVFKKKISCVLEEAKLNLYVLFLWLVPLSEYSVTFLTNIVEIDQVTSFFYLVEVNLRYILKD